MSGALAEFNKLMGQRMKESASISTAWVTAKAVDWDKKVMTAIGVVDELEYYDVLLGVGAETKKPKPGTKCVISIIGNQPGNSFLVYAEELEEVEINVGDSLLHIKESGFILKKDSESLKQVLNDMIDELNKIVVIQGTTINVVAMNAIKLRLNKILVE